MNNSIQYILLGFLLAAFEEFITQGVLKNNLVSWFIPTIIAFVPFLMVTRLIGKTLENRFSEWNSNIIFYLTAGFLGLMIEWFLIGLVPWGSGHPILMFMLQLGIFSFWGSVAFAPRILMDSREKIIHFKQGFKRILIFGYTLIYFIALTTTPIEKRFGYTISAVILFFLALNIVYYKYLKKIV